MPKSTSSRGRSPSAASSSSRGRRKNSTQVMTQTSTITNAKIMMATLALFLANGMALIGVPVSPSENKIQLAAAPKCGVKSTQYSGACGVSRYTGARVVCHDGTYVDIGNGVCTTVANLSAIGTRACTNRCSGSGLPVVERPRVTVKTNADTPLATNLLMGSVDNTLAKFDLSVNDAEDVQLREFVVSFHIPLNLDRANSTTGTLRNIRLYDGDVQIGEAIATLVGSPAISTYNSAVFRNLNVRLVKRQTKTLTVKADVSPYEIYQVSGGRFQPAVLSGDYDRSSAGVQYAVSAVGMSTGLNVEPYNDMVFVSSQGRLAGGTAREVFNTQYLQPSIVNNVEANQFVAFRSKLSISWAGDTPSGMAVPSANQTIAKIVVNNVANTGVYSATVKQLNFELNSTISNAQARTLNVYRDNLSLPAVATTQFAPRGSRSFVGATNFTAGSFSPVEISSGASKLFIATLDTSEARANTSLSVSIPYQIPSLYNFGVLWSDGVLENIVAHDNLLPLSVKTFVY